MERKSELTLQDVKFFWAPPDGAKIVGIKPFEDMIVIATTNGVYTICHQHKVLDDYVVHKVSDRDMFKVP
jgi:hypothetical protein